MQRLGAEARGVCPTNQDIAIFLVPALIALGGILVAGGGLYFFDIKFLHNARQASASLVAGLVIFGLLEILLYGSANGFFNAQQLQTSACELEGESAHPEARLGANPAIIRETIVACMKEAGYEWSGEHRHCKVASVATNPFCYLPISAFDRTVTSTQMSFQ